MKEELSACEAPIMKIVWESNPDISVPELIEQLKVRYGKEYARTTVVTFLTRLAKKGYVMTQRKGRVSYVHALKSEQAYKQSLARREVEFWFHGSFPEFMQAFCAPFPLSKEARDQVMEQLNRMEIE